MQKIIKVGNNVTIFFENGGYVTQEISDEDFDKVVKAKSDDEVLAILNPKTKEIKKEREKVLTFIDKVNKSKILRVKDNIIYWDSVSKLSIPKDFAEAIITAESNNDTLKITTYKNFWTLMSLNTDENCRNNLYWFLKLHGLRIAKCGFFVAYRNVDTTEEESVYTDRHSHSTRIKVGEMVTMPRSKCDCNSNNECSRGLHCASAKWLKKNYYGDVGLACLVNPSDVVAVP